MKISVSTGDLEARLGFRKMFQLLREAGFEAVDLGLGDWCGKLKDLKATRSLTMSREEYIAYYEDVYRMSEEFGICIGQTHTVFGMGGYLPDPELFTEATVRELEATSVLHCHHAVVHPLSFPGRIFDEGTEECFEKNIAFFRSLLPYLEKYEVKIGLEPMWVRDSQKVIRPTVCSRPEEILAMIHELGSTCFCACPDIGHAALTGNDTGDTPGDFLRKLGNAVEIVHLHEVDGIHDNHTAPFTFEKSPIDWADIRAALHEIGYQGNCNFEVGDAYFGRYPDALLPEALRHLYELGQYLAN